MSELGERLKHAREVKGFSLEELQQITKIQKRYLIAIEEGDLSRLPGEFYGRAFVKSYSEAVGLNSEQIFKEHQNELPQPKKETNNLPPREKRSRPHASKRRSGVTSFLPTLIVILFIFAVVGVFYFVNLNSEDDPSGTPRNESQTQVSVNDSNTINNEPSNENNEMNEEVPENENIENADNNAGLDNEETSNNTENNNEVVEQEIVLTESGTTNSYFTIENSEDTVFTIEFSGSSWLDVREEGGGSMHSSGQNNGDEIQFEGEIGSQYRIRLGNTPAAVIYVNGEEIEYPSTAVVQNIFIEFPDTEE